MGTIKLEIDLPEFDKELSINVTIHRDGEVYYTTSSSSMDNNTSKEDIKLEKENSKSIVDNSLSKTLIDRNISSKCDKSEEKGLSSVSSTTPAESTIVKKSRGRGGNMMGIEI